MRFTHHAGERAVVSCLFWEICIYNKGMDDRERAEFISTSLAEGKADEEIYTILLGRGAKVSQIQDGFAAAGTLALAEDTQQKTVRIILTVAAVLIGAGIFSFIASNWQVMTPAVKISSILLSMVSSYAFGWYFRSKPGFSGTGNALIFLGSLIYGAGIFLVAQIYHIRANWPDGFILWMLGVQVMAYAIHSYGLFWMAVPLGVIALAGHPFIIFSSLGYSPFLLTSSLLLLAATISTFLTGLYFKKRLPQQLAEYY
jgi:uncharacterized membrane protein